MPSWHLADAGELAAQYPYTFYKPSPETIAKIAVGENVKLIFSFQSDAPDAPSAERMWVLVDEIGVDGRFKGRLDNTPAHIRDLKADDPLEFEVRHIIATEHHEPGDIVERYIKRCFVTNRVLRDGRPPVYLYREDPDYDDDSGWRITANDETDEYMDDAENSAYVSLGAVLNVNDSFVGLLDSPTGSAFALDARTGRFVLLKD